MELKLQKDGNEVMRLPTALRSLKAGSEAKILKMTHRLLRLGKSAMKRLRMALKLLRAGNTYKAYRISYA